VTKVGSFLPLLALVLACTSPAPGDPTPVPESATPAPTMVTRDATVPDIRAGSTPLPTLVATPQPFIPDTPSAELRVAFRDARLFQVEGDYAAAAQKWRVLLGAPEARFGLALALASSGNGADALQILAAGAPDTRDDFVRGLALDATHQHAAAMQALANYAAANPAVAAAVWLEIAERELNASRPREAADATAKALELAQTRPLKQRLLDVRAQALATLGDNESAFDAHRQVLALATNGATLGEQLFHLAQVSRDLGKPEAALQALKTALDQFPSASTTADALRLVDDLGLASQIDPFVLGRARYFAVDYRNAVTAFDQYLSTQPDGPDAPAARLYKALAGLLPGNEPNALRELDALAEDPNLDSDLAAQGMLEAGQALEGLYEPRQAEIRYQRLLEKFPRLDAAATAGFRLGLVRFERGAYTEALAAWDGLSVRRDDLLPADVARAMYWRGKALTQLGRPDEARSAFQDASSVRPSSYYTLRAASVIGQLSGTASDPGVDATDDRQVARWLGARGQDLDAGARAVAGDPALARAEAEASIGLYRQGNWEADELLQRNADRPDRLYSLSRRFADLGLVGGSTRLGRAAYTAASLQTPQDAPRALLQLAYPRPFVQLSDSASARYGIDPLMLDATLHDASQFDAWSENAATGARGLASMDPVHADEASRALHTNADDRFRPVSAIEQQAWLLADRLRRFDGRPEVALTAISTTDRLVDTWAVRGESDVDAYIELIDYEGVRAGLRGLLATRLIYAVIYGGAQAVDPLAPLSVKPDPTAAWIKISHLAGDVPADAPLSAVPTPEPGTADQQAMFVRGATLQRDGDYPGAAAAYAELVSVSAPDVALEARLRLGQSLIAAHRPADALEPLQAVVLAQPGSTARFLIGRALADLGRCQDAVSEFDAFATASPEPLAAHARLAQASCLAELGRPSEAVQLLEPLPSIADISRLQSLDFREKLALMRVRAGDVQGARTEYQSLLSIARSHGYRSELSYYLGVLAPDSSTAAGYFRDAVQLDQKGSAAQAALDELVELRDPFALSFEAGETRFAQNRYREALAAYTTFLQDTPSDRRAPQALYARGLSLVRLGQDRTGIAELESVADRFPNASDAADGLFRSGRIRESFGDLSGAASAYRRVLEMAGAGPRALDAQFRLAFVQLQQGALSQAVEGWQTLAGEATAADARAQALFWVGKALHAQGDEAGARAAWASANSADPRGFYGLRAADWLYGADDPRADVQRTLARVQAHADDDPLTGLTSWIASRGDAAAAQERLSADPGLARADALLAMGLRQPAIWELGAVESRVGDNLGAMALLGGWEQRRGLYHPALLLGYDLSGAAHLSLTSGPPAIRRLLYPLPHPLQLAQAARQLRVDPLLFSALMLQESVLDQSVESSAQARGLSQMIASTAHEAARALGHYAFHTTDLYQPKTSITLGAFTFGERLTRFDQRIFPALAAYNASEFAVDGWLLSAAPATDIDTFAEAIPFSETYPYVQRIYENYRQYLDLY
jgi:soluble lytic murein transglycosylase